VRILSQRAAIVDKAGRIMPDWFTFLLDLVRRVNGRTATSSTERYSLTGSAVEAEAVTTQVQPGNTGTIRLTICMTATDNANSKTVRVKLGGQTVQVIEVTSGGSASASILIVGRAADDQFISPVALYGCTADGGQAATADMSGTTLLAVTMQLGTITDTIALESWALDVEQA
jgi:hypothetical protein